MFYKKAKQEAEFNLQVVEDKVKRQKNVVQSKIKDLEKTYSKAEHILKQVDEFQGHISGVPQKYISELCELKDISVNRKIMDKLADESHRENTYSVNHVLSAHAINAMANMSPVGKVIQKTVVSKKNKDACDQAYHQIEKLKEFYEELKEAEVKLESKNKKLQVLMTKTFEYLLKLQSCNIIDYKQFDNRQASDFKTMILNSLNMKELIKEH